MVFGACRAYDLGASLVDHLRGDNSYMFGVDNTNIYFMDAQINQPWNANPGPQTEVLRREEFEVGYGGARGGGKTEAGLAWLTYDSDHPKYRALVIRKNSIDLDDWISRAEAFFKSKGAIKIGRDIRFPKGGIIRTGHLKDDNAYMKYQGHEYQRMLIEELTQIPTKKNYQMLLASCRSTQPDLRPQVFSSFNPDGPGFFWVRDHFRIEGIPTGPILTKDEDSGLMRAFVPSKLSDNPYLNQDSQYRSFLDSLPDGLREAWRDGSWNDPIIAGAYYTKEMQQARVEGRLKLCPFDPSLPVHTVWDLGVEQNMAVLFVQRTKTETKVVDCMSGDNVGINDYWADMQLWVTTKKYRYGKHFAPHDANQREKSTGKTIIDTAKGMGLIFTKIPQIGIGDGIQKLRLMFPRLYISGPTCEQPLNALLNYHREYDETRLEYKDQAFKDWSNHYADTFRYLAVVEDKMTNEETMTWEPDPETRYQPPGLKRNL